MKPDPDRLLRVPLFAGLSDDDRTRVASWLDVAEYEAGQRIAREGSSGYTFFVLDDGAVRVDHGGEAVATLGPGDVFGEMAFFGDGRRNSDIVAETPVRVFSMFGTRFREMQMSMPEVTAGLEHLVERRRSALDEG